MFLEWKNIRMEHRINSSRVKVLTFFLAFEAGLEKRKL